MNKYDKYIQQALKMGAVNAVEFTIEQIVFDPRTLLKCKYGCLDYGHKYHCPSDPSFTDIEQSIRIFKHYKGGVIIHANDEHLTQPISFAIESQAFVDGHYFALSLSDCCKCTKCQHDSGKECAFRRESRPAFHAVGIDVFSTVKKFNLPLNTLKDKNGDEVRNWYSAVFID